LTRSQNIPIVGEIPITQAPEDIFRLFLDGSYPIWLDSSLKLNHMSQWSFLASDPFLIFRSKDDRIVLTEQGRTEQVTGDPLELLREQLNRFHVGSTKIPIPFIGGAVGYLSYDLGRSLERLPDNTTDDLDVPDIHLAFYNVIVAFDHKSKRYYGVSSGLPLQGAEAKEKAIAEFEQIKSKLTLSKFRSFQEVDAPRIKAQQVRSFFTRKSYCEAVEQVKGYISLGEIYQANLTQRFEAPLGLSAPSLYQRLRKTNPAPFAAFIDCGDDLKILSSSPERFLRLDGRTVQTRPIKGTRPRGGSAQEDYSNGNALLVSEKDQAELTMIVDLERNDLGRVCTYGSVKVPELVTLEEYATVYHLVSTIEGKLSTERDIIDLIRATFPSGSITGAPKIRAMEIIEKLEPTRRGIYTGSIGYIGFDGNADFNVAIRTLVNKGSEVHLQVGAGIVYDSEPELEYEETLYKAKALFQSLGIENS